MNKYPSRQRAEQELEKAQLLNPGKWIKHSQYVGQACYLIAQRCPSLDAEKAYILGLLHDIGRRIGLCGQKHIYAGYQYAMENDWDAVARISLTHSFLFKDISLGVSVYDGPSEDLDFVKKYIEEVNYDDYDYLVQLADSLGNSEGFCMIETRVVDVALRYGEMPGMIEKWRRYFEMKQHFDQLCGCNIYELLPGLRDNILK